MSKKNAEELRALMLQNGQSRLDWQKSYGQWYKPLSPPEQQAAAHMNRAARRQKAHQSKGRSPK